VLKPVKTFHMHSDDTLQFVFTKTFFEMLDTITKTLRIEDESSELSADREDYDMLENEEDLLIEKYRDLMSKDKEPSAYSDLEDEVDADDKYDENPSFNFLVKNELGFDVSLEAVAGFKFHNIDCADKNDNIDKISLKDGNTYPITMKSSSDSDNAFAYRSKRSNSQTVDSAAVERKSMRFNLDV
jgi:hypothetical protein